jgi:hypothetical protein
LFENCRVTNVAGRRRDHGRHSWLTSILWVTMASLVWADLVAGQTPGFEEPEVKAVFLLNFAQFVEWPASAFADRGSAFVIGILGNDPFGHILDDVVKGEEVSGRALVVERFRSVEDIVACHILFLGRVDVDQFVHIFATLRGRPILTVGDTELFVSHGGTIRFVTAQNRIRLLVNIAAAKAANLTISSKLLRAADLVGSARPR